MEQSPKPVYSPEKYRKLYLDLNGLFSKLLEKNDADWMALQTEVVAFADRLDKKYVGVASEYAMFHVLREEAVIRSDAVIKYEDFPGFDSVERFVDGLVKRYTK